MKAAAFWKQEEGSVAVLVAISLTVLLGFTALAVDFGLMASKKQSLQNAVDAAALAGAADLGAGKSILTVCDTVEEYCAANGANPDEEAVSVSSQVSDKTVTVRISRELPMGFSTVLTGEKTRTVSAAATAEAISIFGGCPYALFAGQKIEDDGAGITITGNNILINGNIHSNSDITMRNAVLGDGVTATAVRNISPSTSGWNSGSIALDMPSFRSFERALANRYGVVELMGDQKFGSKDGFQTLIDEAEQSYLDRYGPSSDYLLNGLYIHISGSLRFNGNGSTVYDATFPIVLIVDGDIDLNGAPINSTRDFPVSIMSESGNITVNGGGAEYTGILFAPQGDVTLNGNDASFVGSIVAQNIRKAGGKTSVSYDETVDRFLPLTKVHLIA